MTKRDLMNIENKKFSEICEWLGVDELDVIVKFIDCERCPLLKTKDCEGYNEEICYDTIAYHAFG